MTKNIETKGVSTKMSDNQSLASSKSTGACFARDQRWGVICDLLLDVYRRDLHMVTGAMLAEDREEVSDE